MKPTTWLLLNKWLGLLPRLKPRITKPTQGVSLSPEELQHALSILSLDYKLNPKKILIQSLNKDLSSPQVQTELVEQISQVMNQLNLPRDKQLPLLEKDHFHKIVDGLSLISDKKWLNKTQISSKELSTLIRNFTSQADLLELFDTFYFTGKLTAKVAIEILLNKHLKDIGYLNDKIFHKNKYIKWSQINYHDYQIAQLQKSYQVGHSAELKNSLNHYLGNEYWIKILQNNEISTFAERTLWKFALIYMDINVVINTLVKINSVKTCWLCLESFYFYHKLTPTLQLDIFEKILKHVKSMKLTLEQDILIQFLSHELIRNSPDEINNFLQISLKSNITQSSTQLRPILIRELTQKLFQYDEKYPDFDLSDLQLKFDSFVQNSNDLNNDMTQLLKLFNL